MIYTFIQNALCSRLFSICANKGFIFSGAKVRNNTDSKIFLVLLHIKKRIDL